MADLPQENPLLAPWDTPYGLPPFDRIRSEQDAEVKSVLQASLTTVEARLAWGDRVA